MWTLLIDILLYVFLPRSKKTPTLLVIALTVVVIGYAIAVIFNNGDFYPMTYSHR
jgi:hypothetical protein